MGPLGKVSGRWICTGVGLEGGGVRNCSDEGDSPRGDSIESNGGERVSPLCLCVGPDGVMVLGDLLIGRELLVSVLARWLSSSW